MALASPLFHSQADSVPVELYFQIGLHREVMTIQRSDLHLTRLTEVACYLVESQFSQGQLSGMLSDKIHLFVHDVNNENMLRLLKPQEELNLKCRDLIEIVVSSKFGDPSAQICQHDLNVHSYHAPAFCDYCGEMLFGIVRQGLRCKGCGQNYHKRCAYKIPNDCSLTRKRKPSTNISNGLLTAQESFSSVLNLIPTTSAPYCGRPIWIDILPKIKVPHTFQLHTFKRPTKCGFCHRVLLGVYKQGLQCKDCKYNCHKKCAEEVPDDCPGEELNNTVVDPEEGEEGSMDSAPMDEEPIPDEMCNGKDAQNIPLMRVVQSIKHKKTHSTTVLNSGWLFHFSNRDSMRQRKRHYWRLDTKSITLYRNETGSNYFKEIPLSEVLGVTLEDPPNPGIPHYSFRIQTSRADFYVGDDTGENSENILQWFQAIQQALMPVEARVERISSNDTAAQKNEVEQATDISQIYQVDPNELLGSGQFGIVYGGKHRKKGFDVAVKVVDKKRFAHKDESQLRREVDILQVLDSPGIVKLYNMFETPEQIFVVMEKLRGDMLEMILSSEKGRLPERITKFMVTQILMALRYLHNHDIVHCDLKPENVLISSDDPLPQLKLCDFGFARIIGPKSFRRSVVGTPAYLAPEVLRNEKYNRSLDMWSVGVIIYVSLSGTFPFNEDEDIHQQIQNAYFMYPPNPWKEMSDSSKRLIDRLLQVNIGSRLSVDKAVNHEWLQDYQTWLDLRQLEEIVGQRYLTHSSDDDRWEAYGREYQASLEMQQMVVQ